LRSRTLLTPMGNVHARAVVAEAVLVVVGGQRRAEVMFSAPCRSLRARGVHLQHVDQRGGGGDAELDVETDPDLHGFFLPWVIRAVRPVRECNWRGKHD
jgi:hypothetical protein